MRLCYTKRVVRNRVKRPYTKGDFIMTQYQQMKAVLKWLADSYGQGAGNLEPADLTEFFRVGDYGDLASVNDYEAFSEEYDLEALGEFWNEGDSWSFYDLAGLFD